MNKSIASVLAEATQSLQAIQLAASDDVATRLAAARRFGVIASSLRSDAEGYTAALAATLREGGASAATGARLLAALGSTTGAQHLLEASGSAALPISQSALYALISLAPTPENAALLCEHWPKVQVPAARFLLVQAIAQQPGDRVLDWASELLKDPPAPHYADVIVRGIAAAPNAATSDWLQAASSSRRAEVKLAAFGAQLQSGDAQAFDPLLRQASAGKQALRRQALVWLTGAPFPAVEAAFAAAFSDASASLREAALLGAPFVASPSLVTQATALLADPKVTVARQAEAVFWLLTGQVPAGDAAAAQTQAKQVASRLPEGIRCLQGKPLEPTQLAALLPNASYAWGAMAALRMMSPEQPEFRPDCDLIRNLDAITAWEAAAGSLAARLSPGERYYQGRPI